MKYLKILILITLVLVAVYFSGCKKDTEIGGTAVEKMSGDWYVTINDDEESYFTIYTFNTSDNSSTQIWIQANGLATETEGIGVKGKINADIKNQSFSGSDVVNIGRSAAENPTFSIANGKIITNGTVGPGSHTPTDSILFDLTVGGRTYKISGYHKTGFLEDQQ